MGWCSQRQFNLKTNQNCEFETSSSTTNLLSASECCQHSRRCWFLKFVLWLSFCPNGRPTRHGPKALSCPKQELDKTWCVVWLCKVEQGNEDCDGWCKYMETISESVYIGWENHRLLTNVFQRFIGRIVHSNCQKTFWTHGQSRITCSTTLRAKMNDNKLGTSNTSKRTTAVAGNRNCAPNCPARQPKTRVCPNSNLPPTNAIGQPSLERENEQRLRTRHAAGCAPFMAAQPSVDVALTPEAS